MKLFSKAFIFVIVLLFIVNSVFVSFSDDISENEIIDFKALSYIKDDGENIEIPQIGSSWAIAMDTITGRVLYEKNAYEKRPMASTTKIMTAIIALEKGKSDDIVTVSARAAQVSGSQIFLVQGEKIKLRDLLYGLMLNSGNDAAIAIAEHIGGSVENFASMMTNKAREIGAYNTAFVTPHGLDREGHYTTPYDLALITRYALKNKMFSTLVSTNKTTIQGYRNSTRSLYNTNELLAEYSGADGVKTGYTGRAGRCLVTSVTRNNWRVISVVLGSGSRYQRASDSIKILDYVFNNYKLMNLSKLLKIKASIFIKKGKEKFLDFKASDNIPMPLKADEISQLQLRYDLPQFITAPIKKGTKIGSAVYRIGGMDITTIDFFSTKIVEKMDIIDYTKEILGEWIQIMRFKLSNFIT